MRITAILASNNRCEKALVCLPLYSYRVVDRPVSGYREATTDSFLAERERSATTVLRSSPALRGRECDTYRKAAAMVLTPAPGVGAAFEYHAETKKRAPAWTQRLGLERPFRFASEPVQLGPRYLRTSSEFLIRAVGGGLRRGRT